MAGVGQEAVGTGRPAARLGVTHDGAGVDVAVWAPEASAVWFCMFDADGRETRHTLPDRTDGVWRGYVADVTVGQRYGFRADGPWAPARGHLFNPAKLLLDPYARAVDGTLAVHPGLAAADRHGRPDRTDTAAYVPRGVVVADRFDWSGDERPNTPWQSTVIYEAHVKGLTMRNPNLPARLRGTFAGVGHEGTVGYLQDLGITAVELLPVQQFVTEPALAGRRLVNYWGYNTIGFFAPHAGYSSSGSGGEQIDEFRSMVKALHAAGIEVILDVVYNHTAEGSRRGPTLSFRGLDDAAYYRHLDGAYADVTGCGNTVNAAHPQVLQLIMDSLRYWVTELHVDGFRFDLASALLRNGPDVDLNAPFLAAVHQDPVLRGVKLIAEPWDATSEGYLVGRFPPHWCEWNDKYRDTVRDFWRSGGSGVRDLALRLAGSADLYADDGRLPLASINFVTAHDGFTLRDLVSYEHKHNEANGEHNRDGTDNHRSWNCGVEGETADPVITALRVRQAANFMATLLLSTGVPMLVAGDERGRTQLGNNNAFCHDSELSWLDWTDDPVWAPLHDLTRRLIRLRADHPVLRQPHFFEGGPVGGADRRDVVWLQPDGREMDHAAWVDGSRATLGILLAGDGVPARSEPAVPIADSSYLIWLHSGAEPVEVVLPEDGADHYRTVLRTDDPEPADDPLPPGKPTTLAPHTFAVFEAVSAPGP
jgi:glycogen debranching enzyme GlgX